MRQVSEMVAEFHLRFGLPIGHRPSGHAVNSDLRMRLIEEEVTELKDAVATEDVVEIADALADIVYVAYGTALTYGINLDRVLEEVHRSNMTKQKGDSLGKVQKGPDYEPPCVELALF